MFGKLESLRGVAACLVILFHSPFNFGEKQLDFVTNSYLFVDFFFILSGFVMSYAYEDKIKNGLSFKRYITLRLGRIYPLHLVMLFAWIPYILIKQYLYSSGFGGNNPSETANFYSFVSNLFLLHSFGVNNYLSWNNPSWSISAEFFAYIVFFITSVTIDKKNNIYIPLLISVISYTLLFNLDRSSFDITYDYGFLRCIAAFYIGVFIFRLKKHNVNIKSIQLLEVLSTTFLIISVTYSNLGNVATIITMLCFAFTLLVFTSETNGIIGKLLESHLMRSIGLWSYSIYMLHALIIAGASNVFEFLLKIDLNSALGFYSVLINIALLFLTIQLSKYSYLYVEKKYRDIIKHKILGSH